MTGLSPLPLGRFGPLQRGGSGAGPQPRRIALAVLAGLGALLLVVAGTAGSLLLYGQLQMRQVEVGGRQEPGTGAGDANGQPIEEAQGVINILAIGTDSRQGLSREQLRRLGTNRAGGMNTDSIIVAQLDLDRDELSLLSFPRDLRVTRCDGSRGRINAAYAVGERGDRGGPTCLVQTVTELTGIPIHHYVQVDFSGFLDIVDALGGVSMWLEQPLQDRYAGVDLPAGCVRMDGATALGYVRSRHAGGRGDFSRMQRQQRFLHSVLEEAVSVGTLVDVPKLVDLVGAAARAVETDEDLGIGDMRRLAFSMREVDPESMRLYTVPGHNMRVNGAWMVDSNEHKAQRLYAAFRRGTDVPPGLGAGERTGQAGEPTVAGPPPRMPGGAGGPAESGSPAEAASPDASADSSASMAPVSPADPLPIEPDGPGVKTPGPPPTARQAC